MKDIVALILAGGKIGGFDVLTDNRAKAALPFAGSYRLIDFALSNLSNSEIEKVGIIIQYLPASLIEHVGIGTAWDFHGYGKILKIMPPFVGMGKIEWFKGTADAVLKNLNFIYEYSPRDVLVVCGDHIYEMDYRPVIDFHRRNDADVTIIGKHGNPEDLSSKYGYFEKDFNNRVTKFFEKPSHPSSNLFSIGIYVFKTEVLIKWLNENNKLPEDQKTNILAADIIQKYAPSAKSFCYEFNDYWNYLEDINVYYTAQMELLKSDNDKKIKLDNILSNMDDRSLCDRVPFFSGKGSSIKRSLIAPGCIVEGNVEWSVFSPGVIVEEGAEVKNSIIFHDCVIKKGAKLNRVVADKDSCFGEKCEIGENSDIPWVIAGKKGARDIPESFREVPNQNLTIVGKNVKIGRHVIIKSGCVVHPGSDLTSKEGLTYINGERIK